MNVKGENKFAANKTEHKDQTKNIIEIQTCKVDLNDVFMCYRDKKDAMSLFRGWTATCTCIFTQAFTKNTDVKNLDGTINKFFHG